MKYYYKFGYSTYEEHGEITMLHNVLFTKEQIEKFTENAYEYSYIKMKDNFYLKKHSLKHFLEEGITFQALFDTDYTSNVNYFVEYFENQGFKKNKITEECFVFGWTKADEIGDWIKDTCPNDLELRIQKRLEKIGRKNE